VILWRNSQALINNCNCQVANSYIANNFDKPIFLAVLNCVLDKVGKCRNKLASIAKNFCGKTAARHKFNFVVSTNARAVALWERKGFRIIGRSPLAYQHATLGAVDAVMMHRAL
jgi:hypothetical protein